LDLSNNNIEELNLLVFHQTPMLKYLNLAHNMIRSFNFELYFPMNKNSDSSNQKFHLGYLNVSSNHLTSLDLASMNWLIHTRADIDLTANPWNCDCSVLLEVWRGLKHKLELHCASPRQLRRESWDMMEEFCSQVSEDVNKKFNTSSEYVSPRTECKKESVVNIENGGPSVITTTLIVTVVLLFCAIVVGLILAMFVKRWRNRQKTPDYCDVYAPSASQISLNLYAEVGTGSSHLTDHFYADDGRKPSYISVLSDADVGSERDNAT
jgi:ABC-type sugar transport system permease subunit